MKNNTKFCCPNCRHEIGKPIINNPIKRIANFIFNILPAEASFEIIDHGFCTGEMHIYRDGKRRERIKHDKEKG